MLENIDKGFIAVSSLPTITLEVRVSTQKIGEQKNTTPLFST